MIGIEPKSIKLFFANKLRQFRLESGLTQKELAENSGLSHKYIYRLETGDANPSIQIVNMLARTLGVPFMSFFSTKGSTSNLMIKSTIPVKKATPQIDTPGDLSSNIFIATTWDNRIDHLY